MNESWTGVLTVPWVGSYRAVMARLVALAACGLVIWCAVIFRPKNVDEGGTTGLLLVVVSVLVLGVALWLRPREANAISAASNLPVCVPTIRRRAVLVGLIGLATIAAVNALPDSLNESVWIGWLGAMNQQIQFWLLWVSLAILVWGVIGIRQDVPRKKPSFLLRLFSFRLGNVALWALLAITLLAFVVRVWNLEYAIHRFVDEILYIDGINRLWDNPSIKILTPFNEVTAFTWLYPYAQMMSVSVFGTSLTSIRLVSAVIGTLTIPAVYLLGTTLFDRKTAVLAALFLATFPPHIHFSRLGLNNIADPLFGTLALALLARGVKHGTWRDFVLAGVCLGLTQYFYEGGRLLFPPLLILWAGMLLFSARRRLAGKELKPLIQHFLVFFLMALAVAIPIYTTLKAHGLTLTPRMDDMGEGASFWQQILHDPNPVQAWLNHVRFSFWFYVQMGDTSWFYGGDWGLIQDFMLPAFFLGMGWAVWRARKPGFALLLVWVVVTALGNGLLRDTAEAPRFIVAFPALALLMAVGIRYTLPLIFSIPPRQLWRWTLQGGVVLGVLALAVAQIAHYFGPQLYAFNHQFRISHDPDDAIFRALQLPRNTDVHIIGDAVVFEFNMDAALRFWGRNTDMTMSAFPPEWLTEDYLRSFPPSRNQAFFVQPDDFTTLPMVRKYFILNPPEISPYDVPPEWQFVLYFSPRYAVYTGVPRPPLAATPAATPTP